MINKHYLPTKNIFIALGLVMTAVVTIGVVNYYTGKDLAGNTVTKQKDGMPNIIFQAKIADTANEVIKQMEKEIMDKYNLSILRGYDLPASENISFLKNLLIDPDTAEKLAAYNVIYFASNEFKNVGSSVFIDARLTPRQVLEYIQTH